MSTLKKELTDIDNHFNKIKNWLSRKEFRMISDVANFLSNMGYAMGEEAIKDGVVLYVVSDKEVVPAILYKWNGDYFYITFNKKTKEYERSYN